MKRFVALAVRAPRPDLEALETALRAAALKAGAQVLEGVLACVGGGRRGGPAVMCRCGAPMNSRGLDEKELTTILGPVRYARSAFACPRCGARRYPGDEALDVVDTAFSPGLRRMMARAGSRETFKEAREDLKVYAGVTVSPKSVERVAEAVGADLEAWAERERQALRRRDAPACPLPALATLYIELDGTGIPVVKAEREGRKGKQKDGSAKTREAKLGCVFTQTARDAEGRPVRDPGSTTWVGAIETAAPFGWRLYAEAVRRGLFFARRVVVLGDGAEWIQNLVGLHFPRALFILDLYHAKEHVAHLAALLCARDPERLEAQRERWWDLLAQGAIDPLLDEARAVAPREPDKDLRLELGYLERNRDHMRYAEFRQQGLFVGSGVVEAGCGAVIGQRFKQSGMEWSVRGANAILSLRCITLSHRIEDYWEDRLAG